MTSAQVVDTSVNVIINSPSQDYTHPVDHSLPTYDMTPGFKPFTSYDLWQHKIHNYYMSDSTIEARRLWLLYFIGKGTSVDPNFPFMLSLGIMQGTSIKLVRRFYMSTCYPICYPNLIPWVPFCRTWTAARRRDGSWKATGFSLSDLVPRSHLFGMSIPQPSTQAFFSRSFASTWYEMSWRHRMRTSRYAIRWRHEISREKRTPGY